MFCMFHKLQMLDTDHICLQRDRFGKNDVLCLDVLIYCVSVHAVTYCRPGNMSNSAMVYTAVCFIWSEFTFLWCIKELVTMLFVCKCAETIHIFLTFSIKDLINCKGREWNETYERNLLARYVFCTFFHLFDWNSERKAAIKSSVCPLTVVDLCAYVSVHLFPSIIILYSYRLHCSASHVGLRCRRWEVVWGKEKLALQKINKKFLRSLIPSWEKKKDWQRKIKANCMF